MSRIIIIVVALAAIAGLFYYFLVLPGQEAPAGEENEQITGCISENGLFAANSDLQCCQGLTKIDCSAPDSQLECAECTARAYCTSCGDGECSGRENFCNCPQDCPKPDIQTQESPKAEVMELYGITEVELQAAIERLLETKDPLSLNEWKSSGDLDLFDWLYNNRLETLLDLISDLDAEFKETEVEPETETEPETEQPVVPQTIEVTSKPAGIQVMEIIIGQQLRMDKTTMVDLGGGEWFICSTFGPPSNSQRTCCTVPRTYNTADELDCETKQAV